MTTLNRSTTLSMRRSTGGAVVSPGPGAAMTGAPAPTHLKTTTYVLVHDGPDGPIAFYVGEALDPAGRFERHRRDAADPLNEKEAYAYLRDNGITEFWYDVIEGSSERETVEELTRAGFTLYNSNAGIRSTTKKRDMTFARLNREANERIERRTVLHGPAQQLSKSQVVAARIRGEFPTVEQLSSCEWRPCQPEMIGGRPAKSAEACEYTRLGDVSFYIATRRSERCMVVRHTDGRAFYERWTKAPRERLFEQAVASMNGPYGWPWLPSSYKA